MDSNKINRADVEKWLESHPDESSQIFTAKATPDMVDMWLQKRSSRKSLQDIGWASDSTSAVNAERHPSGHHMMQSFRNVRKSFAGASGSLRSLLSPRKRKLHRRNKSALRQLDEKELFMELIRDIADELDLNTLSHKILSNVSILTNGDRCSLFLVRHVRGHHGGDKEMQSYLVSKLFDVTENSTVEDSLHSEEEEIKILFGQGIAGHVALTKETVNIKNAYEDPRFNPEIDKKTGYRTYSILCMPICTHEGEVVGVAQVINKISGSHEFTPKDEEVFRNYLTFCGIGIMNAQLFEMSVNEYKRNQMLLQLARGIFAEQTSLDSVVHKIMSEAIELMKCRRCIVFIMDDHEMSGMSKMLEQVTKGEKITQPTAPSPTSKVDDNKQSSGKKNVCKQPSEEALKKGVDLICMCCSTQEADSPAGHCRRQSCCVLDYMQSIGFLKAFILCTEDKDKVTDAGFDILHRSVNSDMAKYVAATGETINISEFDAQTRFKPVYDIDKEFKIRSVLCQPIYNSDHKIIGVAQMLNKCNKTDIGMDFTEQDEKLFEAFAIFCGLGIHNTQMYENAMKLMAKQAVSLEVLSYHASSQPEEVDRIKKYTIPTCEDFKLYDFKFSDFELSEDQTIQASLRMFLDCNLVTEYHIPYEVLCRWLLSVRKNYRPVIYHNWRHAFNVAQTMFAMVKSGRMEKYVSKLEIFVLLVACLCHDLDHRGTNNAFQQKTMSALSQLYGTSTMEHHHFDHSVMILHTEGNNIFQFLSAEDYRTALHILERAILSTDLALYFKKRNAFFELVENKQCEWAKDEEKELLRGMMMTACDVAAITKPWEVQRKVAELVASEFFEQGDMEKDQLNEKPIAMMDREKKDQLPKMQVGFIDAICLPVYQKFSDIWPGLSPLYDGVKRNRDNWQAMAEGDTPDEGMSAADEKALLEKQQREAKALEGGTPSNTPPPLTPARDLIHNVKKPSPLAKDDSKPAPPTVIIQPSVKVSLEAASPLPDTTTSREIVPLDKNGKAVTGAENNGMPQGGADARPVKRDKGSRKTISKTCQLL